MARTQRFYAYLVNKRRGGASKTLSVEQQLQLIKKRVAAHPSGRLIGVFTEASQGGQATPCSVEQAFAACKRQNADLIVCHGLIDLDQFKGKMKAAGDALRKANRLKLSEGERLKNEMRFCPSRTVRVIEVHQHPAIRQQRALNMEYVEQSYSFGAARQFGQKIIDFDTIWAEVEHHCSDFLEYVRQTRHLLFRGVFMQSEDAFLSKPREDRRPRDTSVAAHDYVIERMKTKGIASHRGNSLFVSSDYDFVLDFARKVLPEKVISGRVYAIFPCNGFSFSWSRSFKDFGGALTLRNETEKGDSLPTDIDHLIWVADFTDRGFDDALLSGHEILISGVPYYAILWKVLKPDADQYDHSLGSGGYEHHIRAKLETFNPQTRAVTRRIIDRPFVSLWRSRYEEERRLEQLISAG